MLVFVKGGKPENLEKNHWNRRQPTTNSIIIMYIRHWAGIEPEPHWAVASALTTVQSPLPSITHISIYTLSDLGVLSNLIGSLWLMSIIHPLPSE